MLGSLAIATVGAGKFPPPSRYTGIIVLWFLLGIVAQFGRDAARFCSALSGLVLLAMAMGSAGQRLLAWLGGVGPRLGVEPAGGGGAPPSAAVVGAGIVGGQAAARPRR